MELIDLSEIDKKLKETEQELKEITEKKRLYELKVNYDGEDRVVSFRELAEELKDRPKTIGLKTNFPMLDTLTEGFRAGNLIAVSGLTGQGKTSLLQSFTREFASQEIGTLFFTYELMPEEFLEKFGENIPQFSYIPRRHEKEKILWLEEKIIEAIAKYNIKVVMVDHLHYLLSVEDLGKFGNTSLLIGGLMRKLKEIAIKHEIIIFLIAHTKKVSLEEGEKLRIETLRDSSFIGQESDFILFIDRKIKDKEGNVITSNEATIGLVKNRRNGKLGRIPVIYQNNKFKESSEVYAEEKEEIDKEDYEKLL